MYPIFEPPLGNERSVQSNEQMGSKEKVWLRNSRTGRLVMLKFARPGSGEDWSEKVAFVLARRLGIPCPRVDLARIGNRHGVLCWDFLRNRAPDKVLRRSSVSLIHGNELLLSRDPDYPAGTGYQVSKHTLAAVRQTLEGHGHLVRSGVLPESEPDAFSAFVGYLLLDALIGNTDRHHENWGVVRRSGGTGAHTWLAPSYDHASSMGRELTDDKRQRRLAGTGRGTIVDYASKAMSAFWSDAGDRKLTTLEALERAGSSRPAALRSWLGQLRALPVEKLQEAVEFVPEHRLSAIGKRFTNEVLSYNRQRLLRLAP